MNAKAIALFAVLAVALTGGFVIVGADAADGDDFTAEYMTAGPLEGVQITFGVAPYDKIDWLGTVYGDEGTIVKNVLLKFDGNKTAIVWKAKPLAVGTYQVEISDRDKTTIYSSSFAVKETFTVTFTANDVQIAERPVSAGSYITDVPTAPPLAGAEFKGWILPGSTEPFDFSKTPITQDLDFVALYVPVVQTFQVAFYVDGVAWGDVQTVPYGGFAVEPAKPAKAGAVFVGWFLQGAAEPFDFSKTPITQNLDLIAEFTPFVPEIVNVVFMDGETVIATEPVVVGSYLTKIPNDPVHEGKTFVGWCREGSDVPYDFATMPVLENMTLVAVYKDTPVVDVTVTFRVEGAQYAVATFPAGTAIPESKIPVDPSKKGFNFVGWFKDGFEQSFDFSTLVYEDLTLFAKFVEKPETEEYSILYHDMSEGKPVDIWWKGYTSKDDRVMLANGMDGTPGVKFLYWLAEDQKTKLTWNAAFDLNDLDRNDCLIYPASYGMPGHDQIYELNAIYALEIEWIGYDGETIVKVPVIRGDNLEAPYDDETMQKILDEYMPTDAGYTYSWAGWSIPEVGKYTSEQIESVKVNGAWKISATFEKEVKVYDITFISHEGPAVVQTPYGEIPEVDDPQDYEEDGYRYTFDKWTPEITEVTGPATYTAEYLKTSLTKDITITVNEPTYGFVAHVDEKKAEYTLKVPMDFDLAVILEDILTFDLTFFDKGVEKTETHVFVAVPNDDDYVANKHYEFVDWTVSDDKSTYTANFTSDIITSKDLDRIQTFFDYTDLKDGDVVFTMKSKDGLAIPKGIMTVYYYEIAYDEDYGDWVQIVSHCDGMIMDWDEDTYGDNLISASIEYADLEQDGEPFDISDKNISMMWLEFDGYNEAHCESNKATPGQ